MDDSAETTILEEGKVKITNRRIVIGKRTYPVLDITSVILIESNLNDTLRFYFDGYSPIIPSLALIPILLLGLILAILRLIFNIDYLRYFFYLCALWWFLFIVVGIVLPEFLPSTYMLQIETVSGKSNILKSKDWDHIQRVVDAMDDAIARRGF